MVRWDCWAAEVPADTGAAGSSKSWRPVVTIFGDHCPTSEDAAGLLSSAAEQLGLLPPEVARAGAYYLCSLSPEGCLGDATEAFIEQWRLRLQADSLNGPIEEANTLHAALHAHPHPRASSPDLLICTNLAVWCWLLQRRVEGTGGPAGGGIAPALHWYGMLFLSLVPTGWHAEMLSDFRDWAGSPGPRRDIFSCIMDVLCLQIWWQAGINIPFVPQVGTAFRSVAAYAPPDIDLGANRTILVLRSAFWHRPAGRVFATMLQRFVASTQASHRIRLRWMGQYTSAGHEPSQFESFADMGKHLCALDVPAEISQLKVKDVLGMGLPLATPDRTWLLRLLSDMYRSWGQLHPGAGGVSELEGVAERTADWPHAPFFDPNENPLNRLSYWMQLSDYVRFPHILHFSSLPDLLDIMVETNWAEVRVRTRAHHRRVAENTERFYRNSLLTLLSPRK
ncbi:unnamed protein product [Polarella glacialis]|uniref:Uncharacterized protein n=1 Tax=Polarella glacialis TaxID=89957 RepID=A0A813EBW2_POLGL|nr:unnamed protein product [Polarella glacialis]